MRKQYSAEKILIALGGLLGERSIEKLCRRKGIAQSALGRMNKDGYVSHKTIYTLICGSV
jgi:hypothetical protein